MADSDDRPSARQLLHAATGDREAEAEALADEDPEVTKQDALTAVKRAHGEEGANAPKVESDIARIDDARAVHEERE